MKVNSLSHKDDAWPKRLSNLHKPPEQLFVAGRIPDAPKVAVVGTRRVTSYGRLATERIVTELSRAGVAIISGLAIGIDAIAHRAALAAGGTTLAVLPGSLDYIYPHRHRKLAGDIIASGSALISEYASGHRPRREDFIARNRIVAALADAVLVTEAAHKSGTSHTVNFALELGIEVAAVPGPITSRLSEGTNAIIKNGGALVESGADVLALLGLAQPPPQQLALPRPELSAITQLLAHGQQTTDWLIQRCALPENEVYNMLTELEIAGLVARSNDGLYALRL